MLHRHIKLSEPLVDVNQAPLRALIKAEAPFYKANEPYDWVQTSLSHSLSRRYVLIRLNNQIRCRTVYDILTSEGDINLTHRYIYLDEASDELAFGSVTNYQSIPYFNPEEMNEAEIKPLFDICKSITQSNIIKLSNGITESTNKKLSAGKNSIVLNGQVLEYVLSTDLVEIESRSNPRTFNWHSYCVKQFASGVDTSVHKGGVVIVAKGDHPLKKSKFVIKKNVIDVERQSKVKKLLDYTHSINRLVHYLHAKKPTLVIEGNKAVFYSAEYCLGFEDAHKTCGRLLNTYFVTAEERLLFDLNIAKAVRDLHRLQIIWGDAKLENMITGYDNKLYPVDFMTSYVAGDKKVEKYIGTEVYAAPEVLNKAVHDKRSDAYSLGMLLPKPFAGDTNILQEEALARLSTFPGFSQDEMDDYIVLIKKVCAERPEDRLRAEETVCQLQEMLFNMRMDIDGTISEGTKKKLKLVLELAFKIEPKINNSPEAAFTVENLLSPALWESLPDDEHSVRVFLFNVDCDAFQGLKTKAAVMAKIETVFKEYNRAFNEVKQMLTGSPASLADSNRRVASYIAQYRLTSISNLILLTQKLKKEHQKMLQIAAPVTSGSRLFTLANAPQAPSTNSIVHGEEVATRATCNPGCRIL